MLSLYFYLGVVGFLAAKNIPNWAYLIGISVYSNIIIWLPFLVLSLLMIAIIRLLNFKYPIIYLFIYLFCMVCFIFNDSGMATDKIWSSYESAEFGQVFQ